MMYKLYTTLMGAQGAMTIGVEPQVSFLFDPANTDYQAFRTAILSDQAQLEDADGVLMSAEEAKAFVEGLPA